MNLLELVLGQIPEAIYFALFLILTKELKKERTVFITVMTMEYILLFAMFPYQLLARILFFVISFLLLKLLYKEKSQIIDVFTLAIASIILIPISIVSFILSGQQIVIAAIISIILKFGLLYLLRNKLPKIQKMYKLLWNRNDKIKKPIKATTFRAANVVIFNFSFIALNVLVLAAIIYNS